MGPDICVSLPPQRMISRQPIRMSSWWAEINRRGADEAAADPLPAHNGRKDEKKMSHGVL